MSRFTAKFGLSALLACCLPASAALGDNILIQNARVYTMGRDGVLPDSDILIEGDHIERMGQNLAAPDDYRVIDAKGRPVTPGLFAGVSQIGITEVSAVTSSVDSALSLTTLHPEFDVSLAYNPNSSLVPIARVEGHTFTLLGATQGGSIIGGQGRTVALDGGYDSFFGEPVLFLQLGAGAVDQVGGSRAAQWLLLNQALAEVRTAPQRSDEAVLTRAGRQTLGRYADNGLVIFNVNRAADIMQVLRFAADKSFRPVISGGAEAWMVAAELASQRVPVLLNPLQNLPAGFDSLGARLDNAALLQNAGVTIAFSGAGSHNARKLRQMAGNAASYGLARDAALAAITSNPARIFGVSDSFGSLAQGKRADLVIWSGDPLEVTTVADQVIVDGRLDSMESRQTKLLKRYLVEDSELPRAYVKP